MRLALAIDRVEQKPTQKHRETDLPMETDPRRANRDRVAGDSRDAIGLYQRNGCHRVRGADGALEPEH